jgi:hypothetical protein
MVWSIQAAREASAASSHGLGDAGSSTAWTSRRQDGESPSRRVALVPRPLWAGAWQARARYRVCLPSCCRAWPAVMPSALPPTWSRARRATAPRTSTLASAGAVRSRSRRVGRFYLRCRGSRGPLAPRRCLKPDGAALLSEFLDRIFGAYVRDTLDADECPARTRFTGVPHLGNANGGPRPNATTRPFRAAHRPFL